MPLRVGTKPIGLLAAAGRPVEPGTLDALAAVIAIAIERASLLDERKAAEIARRGDELKTALLASLAHDLRTPLTAIRVAASNLQSPSLSAIQLREQGSLILEESERLSRLFEDILEMARIDAGAVSADVAVGTPIGNRRPRPATRWRARFGGRRSTSSSATTRRCSSIHG